MKALLLKSATSKKNYYITFYKGKQTYNNRVFFTPFYGRDYKTEKEAKKAAMQEFLRTNLGLNFYDLVTLTESNGMQIANTNEPYKSKSAITKLLAQKY